MKKTLMSIISILAAITMLLSVTACGSSDETAETKATEASTQAQTEATTESATQAETAAATQAATTKATEAQSNDSSDELIIPNVMGIWKNESNPEGCTIEITSQDDNTIDFTITSIKNGGSQIATSDVTVTLNTEYVDSKVRGTADFEYVDSFQTGGTGSISVAENVITLVINQEYNDGARWSIANATGDYILYID